MTISFPRVIRHVHGAYSKGIPDGAILSRPPGGCRDCRRTFLWSRHGGSKFRPSKDGESTRGRNRDHLARASTSWRCLSASASLSARSFASSSLRRWVVVESSVCEIWDLVFLLRVLLTVFCDTPTASPISACVHPSSWSSLIHRSRSSLSRFLLDN